MKPTRTGVPSEAPQRRDAPAFLLLLARCGGPLAPPRVRFDAWTSSAGATPQAGAGKRGLVRQYLVVRDARGGVGWSGVHLCGRHLDR